MSVAPGAGGRTAPSAGDVLVVQQSFPEPRSTTNPYIVMLRDSLAQHPQIAVRTFSWRAALLGRYDVFHAHWPEILVDGASPLKKLIRQALFVALLIKLAATRTPIVRTMHNLELPSGISRRERALLRMFDRRTAHRIVLNDSTRLPAGQRSTVIPHGHYRDWFASFRLPAPIRGRFGYFGLIRRYKNVGALADAFARVPGDASLRIGGRPSTSELRGELEAAAAIDPRIHLLLKFLDDAELVEIAGESELVVLPYREMHNSGGVLAALSLNRPVLVPDNEVTAKLADEVGAGWVHRYTGEISSDALTAGLAACAEPRAATPDLSAREWDGAAEAHLVAYRAALLR